MVAGRGSGNELGTCNEPSVPVTTKHARQCDADHTPIMPIHLGKGLLVEIVSDHASSHAGNVPPGTVTHCGHAPPRALLLLAPVQRGADSGPYRLRGEVAMLTPEDIQAIADTCRIGGYNFSLALRTAARDGVPWYLTETPSQAFDRMANAAHSISTSN